MLIIPASAEFGQVQMAVSAQTVATIIHRLQAAGVRVWLDGGWGVDALLGRQSRPHQDLDIVVEEMQLDEVVAGLSALGCSPVPKADTRPWNFVLGDAKGNEVDVHVIVFDESGNGIYGPPENGEAYPADAFSGRGAVGGVAVRCMSARFQIANREGYRLREADHHDIRLLKDAFGL